MKKEWLKPKLVTLYRGRPEEAVLGGCKEAIINPGPTGGGDCQGTGGTQCQTITAS